jgi:hypothetical protein
LFYKLYFIFVSITYELSYSWFFKGYLDQGEMSRQESPKMPRKIYRLSNEGIRGNPSLTETLRMSETPISTKHGNLEGATSSDQRQSSQRRRLSNEYVNRSSIECAQNSAMDDNFLDRLHINTPTPENAENAS